MEEEAGKVHRDLSVEGGRRRHFLCQSFTFLAYMAHFFPIFFAISTLK
jgi:hypothetical protein